MESRMKHSKFLDTYQLDFIIPGITPTSAYFRKQMRHMLNRR